MTVDELVQTLLTAGGSPSCPYPMTPESAADLIVRELLADIPADRQEVVRRVIEEWSREWGSSACSTALYQ